MDLNADVGEGFDEVDEALVPLVTSVNVACGGHAGDEGTMARVVELALRHGVAIGAHPGYPDRDGFGRQPLDLDPKELRATIMEQLGRLEATARNAGAVVRHVKPHGALYDRAAGDADLAGEVAQAVRGFSPALVLVGLAGSRLLEAGRAAGLAVAAEGFSDRAYEPDGTLRGRDQAGAVHRDPAVVAAQALSIARDRRAPLEGGGWLTVEADTICLHSDSPDVVASAHAVREALAGAGVSVGPLGSPG